MKVGLVRAVCGNNDAGDTGVLDRFMPHRVLAKSIQFDFLSLALAHSLTVLREQFDKSLSGILQCPSSIPR
jgi:hypothetical protein